MAYVAQFFGNLIGKRFKLTPFTVTMLTIDRWFDISNAEKVSSRPSARVRCN